MKRLIGLVGAAAVVSTAFAADLPPLHPTRDVAVVYRVEGAAQGGPRQTRTIRMFWGEDGNALRVELEGQPVVALIDFKHGRMGMLIGKRHIFLETKLDPRIVPGFVLPADARASRDGADTVAGVGCDIWKFTGPKGNGSACITQDGLVLRAQGSAEQGGSGQLVATSVAYGPQPESLFQPPPGFARMDLGAPRK